MADVNLIDGMNSLGSPADLLSLIGVTIGCENVHAGVVPPGAGAGQKKSPAGARLELDGDSYFSQDLWRPALI
jgi:hypothetical protein